MAPFPQANAFDKVVDIVNITNPDDLKNYETMTHFWDDLTTARQVDYYISAACYLGLLDDNKEFTPVGLRVRGLRGVEQIIELSRLIVSDPVFGTVYFKQKMLGFELEQEDVVEIMKSLISFDSEAMYERRASTVISWVRWIVAKED